MRVAVGCSMKFRDLARDVVSRLNSLGFTPLFPNLDIGPTNRDEASSPEEKKRLALEHYAAIDKANVVYLLTPGGYMGTSLKLELGYAVAKGKRVCFSEPTGDIGLDCYPAAFVPLGDLGKLRQLE